MKLEPTEAQRKALVDKLSEHVQWHRDGVEMAVDEMIAAANSIPEGAPVGTIARRPDGAWVALRDRFGWQYFHLGYPGDGIDADSWPVIFAPGEAVGSGPTTDGGETYDPREPSREELQEYFHKDLAEHCQADDPTAQQEPGESLARGLDDIAAGRVSRRDDYLEPQQEPATTHSVSPESTKCVPKPRTPRVVDSLGVDERGSRWRNRAYTEFWFQDECWNFRTKDGCTSWFTAGYEPKMCIFTEILEPQPKAEGESSPKSSPRVLPSLDCEEARDGTVWEEPEGWRFWFENRGWRTDEGRRGQNFGLYNPVCLTVFPSYTEVLPDVG
ncbi:Uncharacterised protein [Mycobacteroides abscessus subsp. bolletii]|nr:Uncharacterised protein [Mycobacteroides abscessus subsp. bolletii]